MMRSLRAWWIRLLYVVSRDRREREFSEELESHLQMHVDDNQRAGMSAVEARRVALLKLGGLDRTREQIRDRSGIPMIETLLKDLQFASRSMRRAPGFTAVVLLTLALGIGANAVMFSVVNTLLLRPLPYADPSALVMVRPATGTNRTPAFAAPPDFYRYREQHRTLEHLEAFYFRNVNVTGGPEPERVLALTVSSGFLACLGVQPVSGRGFIAQHEQWGHHRVVIVSDGLWRRRFGSSRNIAGQSIPIDGQPHDVIGILPAGFAFLNPEIQMVTPMAFEPGDNMNSRNNYFLRMVGRLETGTSHEQAAADLNRIHASIAAEFSTYNGTSISVQPLQDALVGSVRRAVLILLGAVAFVLLISCANLTNLLLARAVSRQREIAVRLAMGATRRRLIRQFLIESLSLSILGGVLGLALAWLGANAVNLISRQVLPRAEDIGVHPVVFVFTFAVATATGIALGLLPALHGTRVDLAECLKDGSRGASDGGSRQRLRAAMIVAEIALSLVLLAGAGLMVKSLRQLLHVDFGFESADVLTMQINLPQQKYVNLEQHRQFDAQAYRKAVRFYDDLIERVRSLPGTEAAGAINGLPLMGDVWAKNAALLDRPLPPDIQGLSPIQYRVVAGDYFRALGIRVLRGRAFNDRDTQDAPKVAIISQAMARRHWPDQDPLGKLISVNPPLSMLPPESFAAVSPGYEPGKFTIVGVAADVRYGSPDAEAVPLVYVPYSQGSEGEMSMYLAVRSFTDPGTLASAIRGQVAAIDPDQPIAAIQTMDARMSAAVARPRLQANVLTAFAVSAILLAAIGIYGVMSYGVSQRAKEIGIRIALGAAGRDVVGLVLRQGLSMTVVGVAIGLIAALPLAQLLRSLLFDVSPADPTVFVAIVVLLLATALVAAWIPARRAARLDPASTLRSD
ncbi:MAG TPA: ABC transporter permease [Thermoanaerobaculia bacterium]|nr:ABC transporter permease [Thermoanaerobaculia bacterium]